MAVTSRMLRERGKRQAKELGIDPARVPPGQYLSSGFPVLTVGDNPPVDLATWDLKVFGAVDDELSLSWDDLQALPQREVTTDIHCVTRWSKLDTVWRGVPVAEVLDRAGVKESGSDVVGYCDGGETPHIPFEGPYDGGVRLGRTLGRGVCAARH